MMTADLIMAATRALVAVFLIVGLALGKFHGDDAIVLATVVTLLTAVGAGHSIVHAKTCDGHDGK